MFGADSLKYLGGIRTPHERTNDVTPLPTAYPTDGQIADGLNMGGGPFAFDPHRKELVCGTRYGRVCRLQAIDPAIHTGDDVNTFPVAPYVTSAIVELSGPSAAANPPIPDKSWFEMCDPWDVNTGFGGVLPVGDKVLGAGTVYYDANNQQRRCVFLAEWPAALSPAANYRPNRTPFRTVGNATEQGLVAGYFAPIPPEWQTKFHGNVLMGQAALPIITRGSAGPCAASFHAEHVRDRDAVPMTLLVGYPQGHWMPEHPWDTEGPDDVYTQATKITGMAIVGDVLLFVGSHGYGPVCYGNGTSDPDLAGQPSGDGSHWCYDPVSSTKGGHAYPYRVQVWWYPLQQLADVAAGLLAPWDLRPQWFELTLPFVEPAKNINGCAYDPEKKRLYVSAYSADGYGYEPGPVIYCYEYVGSTTPPIPPDPPDRDHLIKELTAQVLKLTIALQAEQYRHEQTKQVVRADAQVILDRAINILKTTGPQPKRPRGCKC